MEGKEDKPVSSLHSLLFFVFNGTCSQDKTSVLYVHGLLSCYSVCLFVARFVRSSVDAVACDDTMKKVKVKRVNRFDEGIDIYTEFFKPYELTSFDDTFCIAMTNSAR